jgi:hypothetical protein
LRTEDSRVKIGVARALKQLPLHEVRYRDILSYIKSCTLKMRYFFPEIFMPAWTLDFVDAYFVLYAREEIVGKFIRRASYTYAFHRERSSDDFPVHKYFSIRLL